MTRSAVHAFDRIDILVNNAAVRNELPFDAMSLGDWHRCIAVVLDGAFLCTRACLPAMHACGGGRIVNIGGLTAHTGARNRAHVVTAKAGLVGFTKALACDLADDHITVNCVSPGMIQTRRRGPAPAHHAQRTPLAGRLGEPEDVAGVVRMLCGPRGAYITGQTIHVNGGLYMP
jgi:3-oxoacyl-[acyl-carrier protein] reductase